MGLPTDNNMVYTVCFVNGQVLIAQDYEDINYMTLKVREKYQKWDRISTLTTQNTCLSEGGTMKIEKWANGKIENGQDITCCAKYIYLGVDITNEGTLDTSIKELNLLGK